MRNLNLDHIYPGHDNIVQLGAPIVRYKFTPCTLPRAGVGNTLMGTEINWLLSEPSPSSSADTTDTEISLLTEAAGLGTVTDKTPWSQLAVIFAASIPAGSLKILRIKEGGKPQNTNGKRNLQTNDYFSFFLFFFI